MGNPQDAFVALIDEAVRPRLDGHATYLAAATPDPLPVAKADLLYLWDDYRNEMIDFAAHLNPLGHRMLSLHDALTDHLKYYGYTGVQGQHALRWPVEYAQDLSAAFTRPDEPPRKVLFCEGQREAVHTAIRLAAADKPVAVLNTGWHNWLGMPVLFSTDWSGVDWTQYGALLLAPTTVTGSPVPGAREWMLRARTESVPVIVDESGTGFGRTGHLWGQEHLGLMADLTVLGGPLGGGLPLGAVVAPPDWFDNLHAPSPHSGHPWACAMGHALFTRTHPGVIEHVKDLTRTLADGLDGLVGQFPGLLVGHHGTGLLRGLQFADEQRAAAFPIAARHHGLHVEPAFGDTVRLAPVLVSSPHEVTRGVDLMADTLLSWGDG